MKSRYLWFQMTLRSRSLCPLFVKLFPINNCSTHWPRTLNLLLWLVLTCRWSLLFLAHLSICSGWAIVTTLRPSSIVWRPAGVCSHFQRTSPLKPLARFQPNFMRSISGQGGRIIVQCFWLELFPLLWGQIYLYDYKNLLKIFFSETVKPRPLIFSMYHHLMVLYQVSSNYDPWATNTPAAGLSSFS